MLADFFRDEIVPTAEFLSQTRNRLLSTGTEESMDSFFVARVKTSLDPADFEINLNDLEEVKRRLHELWPGSGQDVVTRLITKIIDLAPHFDSTEELEDVSPFIYVMF